MKKKLSKILLVALIAVISCVTLTTTVNAVPDSIELGGTESIPAYIAQTHFTTKTTIDGNYVYCLDNHKLTALNNTAYLVGKLDNGIAYILGNGYPYKSFTGEKLKDYYITQSALWWYLDDTTGSSNLSVSFKTDGSDYYNLRPYIKNLVEEAKKARDSELEESTLSASIPSDTMTLSSDSKYYESEEVTVTSTNIDTYDVEITKGPSDAVVVDENGNEKTTFNANEKFRIQVPVSSVDNVEDEITATITAVAKVYEAYEYEPENKDQQNVAVPNPIEKKLKTTVTVKLSTSKITILKIDKKTGNPLPGAKLILKDKDGKEITTWTSTIHGHIIRNLPNGTYTVEEVSAPDGYRLNNEVVTFTIDDNNRSQEIKFYNEAKEVVVNIVKIDSSTGNPLAGAEIVVRDQAGNEVARFTSTEDPYVLKDLEYGTYTVEEVSAPAGYQKSDEIKTFTVDKDNLSHQIVIENHKEVSVPNTSTAGSILLVIMGLGIIGGAVIFVKKNKETRI